MNSYVALCRKRYAFWRSAAVMGKHLHVLQCLTAFPLCFVTVCTGERVTDGVTVLGGLRFGQSAAQCAFLQS